MLSIRTQIARETIDWDVPFKTALSGGFLEGDVAWFPEGQLNACYNCVDRWAFKTPNKVSYRMAVSLSFFLPLIDLICFYRLPSSLKLMNLVNTLKLPFRNC
jgi:hypothetical protein